MVELFRTSLGNIVMYLILAAITIFVGYVERKDVNCPTFDSNPEECTNGGGMSFSYTKPKGTDTCQELIKKIEKAVGAEQASIKWRRSLILSVIIMAGMWLLVGTPGGLPDWKIFYLSVLISYVILFASFNYYSYHIFGKAEIWAKDAIRDLRDKKCIN